MGVGLFIPLPSDLSLQFPSLVPEDDSPPHVTVLYIGTVALEEEARLLTVLRRELARWPSMIDLHLLGTIGVFDTPNGDVLYDPVLVEPDLTLLRRGLISSLESEGFIVQDRSRVMYNPHVTIEYVKGSKIWDSDESPLGSWSVSSIGVWGLSMGDVDVILGQVKTAKTVSVFHYTPVKFTEIDPDKSGLGAHFGTRDVALTRAKDLSFVCFCLGSGFI